MGVAGGPVLIKYGGQRVSHVVGKTFQEREKRTCKGPVAEMCLWFRSAQLVREW